jgi:hypothetical protein
MFGRCHSSRQIARGKTALKNKHVRLWADVFIQCLRGSTRAEKLIPLLSCGGGCFARAGLFRGSCDFLALQITLTTAALLNFIVLLSHS